MTKRKNYDVPPKGNQASSSCNTRPASNYDHLESTPAMRFLIMQRPILAAAFGLARASVSPAAAPMGAQWANALVQGHRYASVKSQGAYKKKSKRGIPKKLGAKRTGGES
jgi:hypothetical protein